MDRTEYREASRVNWNTMAAVWDERREQMSGPVAPVRDWLIDHLAPREGETILDIACGTGEMTELASLRVGDGGRVICTDFAGQMLDAARRRGEAAGLTNVEYSEMDAEDMHLDDASVDGAICRFGYMLMSDRDAALRETRRVLREHGRLVFAVWAEPARNPWVVIPAGVVMERGLLPPPDPDGPGMFALAGRDKLEAALAQASLAAVEIADVEIHHQTPSREALWDRITTTMGFIATAIADEPEEERAAIRAAIEERAEPFREGDGYLLPGVAHTVLARPA